MDKNAVLRFYNLSGKKLEQIIDDDLDGKTQIDMTNNSSGLVLYSVVFNENTVSRESYSGKIIKKQFFLYHVLSRVAVTCL